MDFKLCWIFFFHFYSVFLVIRLTEALEAIVRW